MKLATKFRFWLLEKLIGDRQVFANMNLIKGKLFIAEKEILLMNCAIHENVLCCETPEIEEWIMGIQRAQDVERKKAALEDGK